MIHDAVKRLPGELRLMLEKRLELMALDLTEGASALFSRLLFVIMGAMLLTLAMFFMLLGLSDYLGELLDHSALGYLVTALPLLLLSVLLLGKRPRTVYLKIKSKILKQLLDLITKRNRH